MIKKVIIHAADTPADMDIGAEEIIHTLEIKPSGSTAVRICTGYQDLTLTLEDAHVPS